VRLSRALAVLQEADAALEGWTCPASTECCRFSVTGKEPWLTEVEWLLVAAEVARQGRKLPAVPEDGTCPFLKEGRCSIYSARPLGCRTFYCDRASGFGSYPRAKVSRLPRELDALSTTPAQPLRTWLTAPAAPRKR
jgi:hypothetical protein